jgi:hypothetical protein
MDFIVVFSPMIPFFLKSFRIFVDFTHQIHHVIQLFTIFTADFSLHYRQEPLGCAIFMTNQ